MTISRNSLCPCGSRKKYKRCCIGEVDWKSLHNAGESQAITRHLHARGKNIIFLNQVAAILQFDKMTGPPDWADVKKAVTPDVVRKLHETVVEIWPDSDDLNRVFGIEKEQSSALYIGTYEPDAIAQGIVRHSLYSDVILVSDPFLYPPSINDKYNPLLHPGEYRAATIRGLNIWWNLAPWIDHGIVRMIRNPGDFDGALTRRCYTAQRARYQEHSELKAAADHDLAKFGPLQEQFTEFFTLAQSDEAIEDFMRTSSPEVTEQEIEGFIEYVRNRREEHPYYVDPIVGQNGGGEMITWGTGLNYEMAKHTALRSGSHFITDLRYRWREIEIDRHASEIDESRWSPFAKAFQGASLKFLDRVDLKSALTLRKEGRLDDMRSFLRRVWKDVEDSEDRYSESLAEDLAAELEEHVATAESDWAAIDTDLLKLVGAEGAAGIAAAGPAIASGHGQWLTAGLAALGVASLVNSTRKRSAFKRTHPAGFFIGH